MAKGSSVRAWKVVITCAEAITPRTASEGFQAQPRDVGVVIAALCSLYPLCRELCGEVSSTECSNLPDLSSSRCAPLEGLPGGAWSMLPPQAAPIACEPGTNLVIHVRLQVRQDLCSSKDSEAGKLASSRAAGARRGEKGRVSVLFGSALGCAKKRPAPWL